MQSRDDRQTRLTLTRAYAELFATSQGKLVLANLRNLFHVDSGMFSDSAMELARNEGQRSVVLHIMRAATLLDKTTTKDTTK